MSTGPVELQGITIVAPVKATLQGLDYRRNILKGVTIAVGTGASIMQLKVVDRNHEPIEGATCRVLNAVGWRNNVLSFDGVDDYVHGGKATPSGSYTVEFWVYIDSLRVASTGEWFANQRSNTSTQQDWQIMRWTGHLGVGAWVWNTSGTQFTANFGPTNQNVETGEWIHLALVVDAVNGKIRAYKNAQQYGGDTSFTGTPRSASTSLVLGKRGFANAAYLPGKIADFRIWDTVRSESEIQENYNKRLVGNEYGLIRYWPFLKGTGSSVNDLVGGNAMTIYGSTWQEADESFPLFDGSIHGYDPAPYDTGTTNANGLTTLNYQINTIYGLEVTLPGKRRFIMPFKRNTRGLLDWQVMLSDYLATFATDRGNILINSEPENNDANFLIE